MSSNLHPSYLSLTTRGTQGNMDAWAWPVEGWDVLAGDDFSEEAEHDGVPVAEGVVAESDPQEGGAVAGADYLEKYGDA